MVTFFFLLKSVKDASSWIAIVKSLNVVIKATTEAKDSVKSLTFWFMLHSRPVHRGGSRGFERTPLLSG